MSLLDGLPKGKVYFEHAPVDLDQMKTFDAMGEPNVLPKEHGGFTLKNPYQLPADVPVYAVASGVIVLASHGTRHIEAPHSPNLGMSYDDHLIVLMISSDIRVNYAHISRLNYVLLPELEELPVDERGHNVELSINAGDIIGWVGPHPAMDFSVTDYTLNLSLINQTLYPEGHYFSANVYDYFRAPVLAQMIAIASRDSPPRGGKIDWDIPGKIRGNWFLEGTTSYTQWSKQMAITYDHIQSSRITISDGSPMRDVPGIQGPGAPDVYWVRGNAPAPETIGEGSGMVTYELIAHGGQRPDDQKLTLGYLLVEMETPGAIKLEVFKGEIVPDAFTSDVRHYVR